VPTRTPERHVILVGGNVSRPQWKRFEQGGMAPELDLDDLVLNWSGRKVKDLQAKGAVTAVQVDATLEGAPTVTINLRDPDRHVFRRRYGRTRRRPRSRRAGPVQVDEGWDAITPPDVLGRPMQIELDGVIYQLVKAAYQHGSGELALTFEHELVYLLKRHKGAKRAPRERVTRAQFILSLVRELEPEVQRRRYRFVCPELNVRQPIDKGQRRRTSTGTTATSSGGSGSSGRSLDRVYPKHSAGQRGVRFTPAQVRACAAAGGFWGQELTAMEQIAHGESDYYPGVVSFDQGYGLWQMTPRVWGAAAKQWLAELGGMHALTNPIVNAKLAHRLYVDAGKSFSPWYGTRYLTVGAGPGNGRPSRADSRDLGETVSEGGSSEGTATSRTVTETKSYQFARARGESSWAAITRLAGEVKWRAYMVGNSLYYMSDEALYGRRPRYQVGPDHPAVLELGYDVDWGKPVSEASLTVTLARWEAPPGSVILLEGFGPPDGRWLVASTSRDYFTPTAEVKLLQPGKASLEPANQTSSRTVRTPGSSSSSGSQAGGKGPEGARKFYARAVEISKKNYDYAWGGGHNSSGTPSKDIRGTGAFGYYCSGYVGACLLAAGVPYGGEGSGSFGALPGAAGGRGKYITVHYKGSHVYAVFESALGVPHERADTNPQGSGPSGPHVRSGGAYPGYSTCHFPQWGD
jgi:hypothetical protein